MRLSGLALLGRTSQPLMWLGVLGIALSAFCSVLAVTRGVIIPPEGDLTKVITFDFALGVYLITLGFAVPLAHFSAAGGRRFVSAGIAMALYAFGMETIQQLRGIDPRFSHVAGPVDSLFAAGFGLDAIGLIGMFSVLAVALVRRGTRGVDGLVLLGLRYAIAATMIAFAAGVWMMVNQGRYTGAAGNILPLHALGFHALQAIPIVAWLFSQSGRSAPDRTRVWIHATGTAWITACVAIAWQTIEGRPVTEPSAAIVLAVLALFGWLVCAVRALQALRASRFSGARLEPPEASSLAYS